MDSEDETMEVLTPPEVLEAAEASTKNLLPQKSKSKYELVYKKFMDWRKVLNVKSFSENVLLAYFGELTNKHNKYKSYSLWSQYSMLRSILSVNHSLNIETYSKIRALLKRKSDGYHVKKAETADEINQFISKAPDEIHLSTKIVLMMGIMGACRAGELHAMNIEDVLSPTQKPKKIYQIKKIVLRPSGNPKCGSSFFLNYQNGKRTVQKIGINKVSNMGKQIAIFLKLPNPELYSGHSFRRSSATLLINAEGDITALKRHGGWESTTTAEGYIQSLAKLLETINIL